MLFLPLSAPTLVNALSPKLAGKLLGLHHRHKAHPAVASWQIVGVIAGLVSLGASCCRSNFVAPPRAVSGQRRQRPLLAAVCATSFAYEGWIIATTINCRAQGREAQPAERPSQSAASSSSPPTSPYYVGVAAAARLSNAELMNDGATAAFTNISGKRHRQHPQPLHRHLLHRHDERPDARLLPRRLLRSQRAAMRSGRSPYALPRQIGVLEHARRTPPSSACCSAAIWGTVLLPVQPRRRPGAASRRLRRAPRFESVPFLFRPDGAADPPPLMCVPAYL